VTEILSPFDGVGATTLALRAATAAAAESSRTVVVIDSWGDFYPPAMWRLGMAVERLVVIRVSKSDEVIWAVDQSLRCSAVAALVAPVSRLDDATSRRLQLAAESGGGVGILLRPDSGRRHSFAAVQMRIEPVSLESHGSGAAGLSWCESVSSIEITPVALEAGITRSCRNSFWRSGIEASPSVPRLCRVTLIKVREGTPVEPFVIDLNDETGVEPLLPVPDHRSVGRPQRTNRRISA
jgi:hypothetical protein